MPRRLIRCETHLLKSLSTLLVGLVIDHSNQVDALLHNLDLQLRHALAVLDLEDRSMEVWSFGWPGEINSIHTSKSATTNKHVGMNETFVFGMFMVTSRTESIGFFSYKSTGFPTSAAVSTIYLVLCCALADAQSASFPCWKLGDTGKHAGCMLSGGTRNTIT